MKIAVSGKGGTGKTTISTLCIKSLADQGINVVAVDGDSNTNLGYYLGIQDPEDITPLSEMDDLIEDRTGAEKGSYGAYFKMNPKVDDIPGKYSRKLNGITLLTMGSVTVGGTGCVCPEYVLLKNLVAHMVLNSEQTLFMDMEAGLEHLGRGVASSVDLLVTVVNPDRVSIITAERVNKLAKDLGIPKVVAVGNRIREPEDKEYITDRLSLETIGFFPYSDKLYSLLKEGNNIYIDEFKEAADTVVDKVTALKI